MKFLLLLFLCLCAQQAFAGNPDILWQKMLTADTLPIRSIAVAEGKYVAALKGNQIIILDYVTGDSVTAFATPKEMYGNDIILGKGGERLYVLVGGQGSVSRDRPYLHSWDIATLQVLSTIDISSQPGAQTSGSTYIDFSPSYSHNGKIICVGITYTEGGGNIRKSGGVVCCFNTEDSLFEAFPTPKNEFPTTPIFPLTPGFTPRPHIFEGDGGIYHLALSHSGNYLLAQSKYYVKYSGYGGGSISTSISANILGRVSPFKSYLYNRFIPTYTFSYGDDFLLLGNQLYDLPPTRVLRTITKPGFAFLPDDNHLLAFKAAGGVAAISNIEKDSWEKVFYGDSLTEKIIKPGTKFTSFATATDKRITLWKIPDTLERATLTAGFTQSKDTIQIYDTVAFTNMTYPFKRGTHYEWSFGDGSPVVTTAFPVHKFIRAGKLTVTLSVRDTLGATSRFSRTIVVDFQPPKANFTTSLDTIAVGNVVQLTNQSTPIRPGTHFTWNFGDGSTFSQELNTVHQYFNTGTYDIILTIRDTLGRTNSLLRQIVVISQVVPNGAVWTNHFHTQRINSLAYSPDGGSIISGSNDGYSRLWDGSTGKQLFMQNVGRSVYSIAFTNDSKAAFVGSYEITDNSEVYVQGMIGKLWNYVNKWNFSQGNWEQKVKWSVENILGGMTHQYVKNPASTSSLSLNNNWFCIGSNYTAISTRSAPDVNPYTLVVNNVLLYDCTTNTSRYYIPTASLSMKELDYLFNRVYYIQITPDNKCFVASQGSRFYIRDLRTDSIYRDIPHQATLLRFSPDKYHLLTNTGLWDIYDSILVQPAKLPQVFEFHPDGIHVFTIRPDSTIGIFNLSSNSYDYLYSKQPVAFTCLAVAPDGKHIATGDNSGYITVWKVPDTLKSSIKIDFQALSFKRSAVKTSDTVEFANTTLPANNSFDYSWNFGDGTTSTERAPKHRYLKPGKFTVSLTAYSNGNVVDSISKTQYITVTGPIGVDESQVGLYSTALSITPNPSYAETQIHLTLAQACDYNVRIMDNLGREIARWEEHQSAGEHVIMWNENVPSGVYYCTLSVGGEVRMVPFVVVR
jgi:PKD repeat protein